ncbi:unnamed protein product, partial [marine sediment metagenome]
MILLTLGELVIDKDLTIDGPGAAMLTIDASGNDPTPDSTLDDGDDTNDGDGSRVFRITDDDWHSGFQVELTDVTLTGGDTGGRGGAIFSTESLELRRTLIRQNVARYSGGGIDLADISGNANYGAPIAAAHLNIRESVISQNESSYGGGGLSATTYYGTVLLERTTVSGNVATGNGGGIRLRAP